MIVVKILKPILTWKQLFCAYESSLQAHFLNKFCSKKQYWLRKEPYLMLTVE
jgi:hypothetical protein